MSRISTTRLFIVVAALLITGSVGFGFTRWLTLGDDSQVILPTIQEPEILVDVPEDAIEPPSVETIPGLPMEVYIPDQKPTTIHLRRGQSDEILISINDLPKESIHLGPCFGANEYSCRSHPGQRGAYLDSKWFASAVLSPDKTNIAFNAQNGFGWIGVVDINSKEIKELITVAFPTAKIIWSGDSRYLTVQTEVGAQIDIETINLFQE